MSPETTTKLGHKLAIAAVASLMTGAGILGAQAFDYGQLTQRVSAVEKTQTELKEADKEIRDSIDELGTRVNANAINLAPVKTQLEMILEELKRVETKLDKLK